MQIVEPGRPLPSPYDANGFLLTRPRRTPRRARCPTAPTAGRGAGATPTLPPAWLASARAAQRCGADDELWLDASGSLVSVTNALGQVTQVTSQTPAAGRSPWSTQIGVTTTLTYDPARPADLDHPAGATTTIGLRRRRQRHPDHPPDGSFLAYGYDAANRLVRVSDASTTASTTRWTRWAGAR